MRSTDTPNDPWCHAALASRKLLFQKAEIIGPWMKGRKETAAKGADKVKEEVETKHEELERDPERAQTINI